tara:strand:- start:7781 stop:8476 length:696 start_codon:yes stop_codon:yes gene_type:complete
MFWQEDDQEDLNITDAIIDLVFDIECKELPVDHCYELKTALTEKVAILESDERCAIHSIHMAGSQNGWERPDPKLGQKLILSKRTKLTLRIPGELRSQVDNALIGSTIFIDGNKLTVGKSKIKKLSKQTTIFARHIALESDEDKDENKFLVRIVKDFKIRDIRIKKALCGITQEISTRDEPILTRSIMLADLSTEDSIRLQQEGLGDHRLLGCGIFIPHKGIDAVKKQEDE